MAFNFHLLSKFTGCFLNYEVSEDVESSDQCVFTRWRFRVLVCSTLSSSNIQTVNSQHVLKSSKQIHSNIHQKNTQLKQSACKNKSLLKLSKAVRPPGASVYSAAFLGSCRRTSSSESTGRQKFEKL